MFRNRTYLGILKLGEEEFSDTLPALVDPADVGRLPGADGRPPRRGRQSEAHRE